MILDQKVLNPLSPVMTLRTEEIFAIIVKDLMKDSVKLFALHKVALTGGLSNISGSTSLAETFLKVPP